MTYSISFEVPEEGEPTIAVYGNAPKGKYEIVGHLHNAVNTDAGDMLNLRTPNGGSITASFPGVASRPPTLT